VHPLGGPLLSNAWHIGTLPPHADPGGPLQGTGDAAQGGLAMSRLLCALLCVVTGLGGGLVPVPDGAAYVVTTTLTQTPVTGQLADGSPFHGRLTVHALTVEASGQLAVTGVLTGTVTIAPGKARPLPPAAFTTPATVLDPPGTCRTVLLDLAPITLAPLAHEVTLAPVIVGLRAGATPDDRLRTTLCAAGRRPESPEG